MLLLIRPQTAQLPPHVSSPTIHHCSDVKIALSPTSQSRRAQGRHPSELLPLKQSTMTGDRRRPPQQTSVDTTSNCTGEFSPLLSRTSSPFPFADLDIVIHHHKTPPLPWIRSNSSGHCPSQPSHSQTVPSGISCSPKASVQAPPKPLELRYTRSD